MRWRSGANRVAAMNRFPYRQLTLIPLATGLLLGAIVLFGRVVPDLVNPHGPFLPFFLLLLLALTVVGLCTVPFAFFQALKLLRDATEMRDMTNFLVLSVGLTYLLVIAVGAGWLAAA